MERCSTKCTPPASCLFTVVCQGRDSSPFQTSLLGLRNHQLSLLSDIALTFCMQYTDSGPSGHRILSIITTLYLATTLFFIPYQVSDTISRLGNSTTTPALITLTFSKYLGSAGVRYLASLFNLSLHDANLPSNWKSAIIIPRPKLYKPVSDNTF